MRKVNIRQKTQRTGSKNIVYNIAYYVAKYGILFIPIFTFLLIANIIAVNTNQLELIYNITIYISIVSILILLSGLICSVILVSWEYHKTKDKNILAAKFLFYLIVVLACVTFMTF